MSIPKYHCPRHRDGTPSLAYYGGDTGFCFACWERVPLSEVGVEATAEPVVRGREDIAASVAAIKTLPVGRIRGLDLHFDAGGYYLVWPGDIYYKYRRLDGEPRYKGPSGHRPPLLIAYQSHDTRTVLVVEGEINALSIPKSYTLDAVVSPGAAGNFYGRAGEELFSFLQGYRRVYLVVDADAAGAKAAIELKGKLLSRGQSHVSISLWPKDANDILVQDGIETLKSKVAETLGLPGEVPRD